MERGFRCPQPIQSTILNLSLDKQPRLLYSSVKVPLTVSPFRPSFKAQSGVYSRPSNFVAPLFSWSYELLFPQPLCFYNLLRCPPGGGPHLPNSAFSVPLRSAILCPCALYLP